MPTTTGRIENLGYRRNRFGHGCKSDQRVLLHRLAGFQVHEALRLEVDHPAAARDERNRPGELLPLYEALNKTTYPAESLGRHADFLGPREGQIVGGTT